MNQVIQSLVAIVGFAALNCSPFPAVAQSARSPIAPILSNGAANVLKLVQANIGEETILAYVQKSDHSYGTLGADEIIYLHGQGVSDRVVATMLDQQKKLRDVNAAQLMVQQTTAATTPAPQPSTPSVTAHQYPQPYVAPTITYVQREPAPLIVMRDSSPRLTDYGIYPPFRSHFYYPSYGYRNYGHHNPYGPRYSRFGGIHSGYCW